jgi:hypothetical protein
MRSGPVFIVLVKSYDLAEVSAPRSAASFSVEKASLQGQSCAPWKMREISIALGVT